MSAMNVMAAATVVALGVGARRVSPLRWAALACVSLGVGCGGGGGGGMGPGGSATLTAPSFVTSPEVRESVDIELVTNRAAAGIQVDFVADPTVIPSAAGVVSAGRADRLQAAFQNVAPGRVRLLLFETSGSASIPGGQGAILRVSFRVAATAPPGTSSVTFENPLVIDEDGEAFDVTVVAGQVTVEPR